jgi:hypothetical protein
MAKKFSPLVQKFSSLFEAELSKAENMADYNTLRSLRQRVTFQTLFIEYLCIKYDKLYAICLTAWNYLKIELSDFKSFQTFEKFVKVLEISLKRIRKEYPIITCQGCNSNEYRHLSYTDLCLDCFICDQCERELQTTAICPKCRKTTTDKIISYRKEDENSEKVNQFKYDLNCFFMNVITNLCFNYHESQCLPEEKVINKIIEILLPKPLGHSAQTDSLIDLNLSPSIKSTLFQLLLNYTQENIEEHLKNIYEKSSRYLKANYNINDLDNLTLLYINSFEDSLYSKSTTIKEDSNLAVDVVSALDYIEEIISNYKRFSAQQEKIVQWKQIAKMKFSLITFAKLIEIYDKENENHFRLGDRIRILSSDCVQLRYFLIKQIFRHYGRNKLDELSQDEHLSWICLDIMNQNQV